MRFCSACVRDLAYMPRRALMKVNASLRTIIIAVFFRKFQLFSTFLSIIILKSKLKQSIVQLRRVMLFIVSEVKVQMVSQSRSTTFSKEANTSLRKPVILARPLALYRETSAVIYCVWKPVFSFFVLLPFCSHLKCCQSFFNILVSILFPRSLDFLRFLKRERVSFHFSSPSSLYNNGVKLSIFLKSY